MYFFKRVGRCSRAWFDGKKITVAKIKQARKAARPVRRAYPASQPQSITVQYIVLFTYYLFSINDDMMAKKSAALPP